MGGLATARTPAFWRNVMAMVALGKAALTGVALGIAALGIVDVATAHHIRAIVATVTHNHALDAFAYSGGAIGIVLRLVYSVIGR